MGEIDGEKPTYYAIIPADIRYDEKLNANEKLMFGEITCLSNKLGYCYASNNYFAKLFKVTPQAVSKWIKHMEKLGYIRCEYEYEGKVIKERRINIRLQVSTMVEGGINIRLTGYQHTIKENNTSSNITSNNNIYTESKVEPKNVKHKHGEYQNVLLTDKEYETLCGKLGEEKTKNVIQNFSELKAMKGYVYKSDYIAINKWGIRAYEDTQKKGGSSGQRQQLNEGYF